MKKLLLTLLLALAPAVAHAYTITAYFSHEEKYPGSMTKVCVYTYIGSVYTKTVASYALCPLTLEVEQ